MGADTESSDSVAASTADAENPVDGSPIKKCQEKVPKKIHKAEREKLKRDHLNDLFLELGSALELDQQNSGKATVLSDAARVLRDLLDHVESLRKEHAALLTECQYVTSEKNELLDENAALQAEISGLQNRLRSRMACSPMWSSSRDLRTLVVPHPAGALCPLQQQQQQNSDFGQIYVPAPAPPPPPQELQLFPAASTSPRREPFSDTGTSDVTDSLPGQLRLSLPWAAQEECSSGAARSSRSEPKKAFD